MIVNGFCKEVFRELPMEFAVEAQKLLGVSLEGRWGRDEQHHARVELAMCEVRDGRDHARNQESARAGGQQGDPPGDRPDRRPRRSARDHGTQRVRQEHAGRRAGGPPRVRGHRRRGALPGPGSAGAGAGGARARRHLPRVPVPGRDSRREQRLLPEGGAQRGAQASRRARARRDRVPGARPRQDEAPRHGRGAAEPPGQRRVLRRREEAQRDPPDGRARADAGHPRRDRLRPRHRRAQGRRRTASTRCAAPTVRHRRHPLSAAARLHRPRLRPRALRGPHRQVRRTRTWRSSSRRRATAGWRRWRKA